MKTKSHDKQKSRKSRDKQKSRKSRDKQKSRKKVVKKKKSRVQLSMTFENEGAIVNGPYRAL